MAKAEHSDKHLVMLESVYIHVQRPVVYRNNLLPS